MLSQRWGISGKPYKHPNKKIYGFAWIQDNARLREAYPILFTAHYGSEDSYSNL